MHGVGGQRLELESATDGRGLVALTNHGDKVAWLSETAEGRAKTRSRLGYERVTGGFRGWGV